jgi:hypothetical protein
LLCKEIAEIARRTTQNELVVAQEKSDISPSILTVFHNGKQEKFTFSYRKGIAFSDF